MDSSKLKAIIVAVLALFVALYLGISAATAQLETVAWVVGGVGLAICLLLGRRIFLLIPLMTSLGLVLPLPGNFASGFIAQGIVVAFAVLLFLCRRLPMHSGFTELEGWCLLLFLSVVQVYLRNPVGLDIFGSDSVGAKPYAVFALTCLCALILSLLSIDPKDFRLWVRLSFIGSILNFTVGSVGWIFPQVGYYLGATFSSDLDHEENEVEGQATRIAFVRGLSLALPAWISSRMSPLRASFHPVWAPLILLSFALAGISGFRTQLIAVGSIFLIGICYRDGFKGVFLSSIIGITGFVLLGFANAVAPLPLNIQRSLTFLPGTWDESIKLDANNSTDFRVMMWKEALLTDKWIHNKWLGDGLGFTKEELARMQNLAVENSGQNRGMSGLTVQQESMMINGGYHSGPVQTVRTIGYIGLVILLIAMIRLTVHTHRQILRCRNTEWFPVALFLGIPMVAFPFLWTFVFGTFESGASGVIMGAALIRMLENNLPLPAYARRSREPFILRKNQFATESALQNR